MSDRERPKPGMTTGQRKPKRSKKPAQAGARNDLAKDVKEGIQPDAMTAATEGVENIATSVEATARTLLPEPVTVAATEPTAAVPKAMPSSAGAAPVGLQTIASAYRDYTRKSFAEATSFIEKLATVRSLDKAVEVQSEYARQACETFAADSRKIRTLYHELFWESLRFPQWPPGQTRH